MTTINKDTVVSLIDTSEYVGHVNLPVTTDIGNRLLIFKDSAGAFNTNPFTISTTGSDSFENNSNRTILSNNYDSLCLYSDPTTFKWRTLFSYNNANNTPSVSDTSNWANYPAVANVDMSANILSNATGLESAYVSMNTLYGLTYPFIDSYVSMDFHNNYISNLNSIGVGDIYSQNHISNIEINNTFNMCNNQICNIQVNYCNIFSNTSIVPSLIAASPQAFSGAIFDLALNDGDPPRNMLTNSESNYLYFERNQYIWKINITLKGLTTTDTSINNIFFTLSNCTSGIEVPLINYRSNNSLTYRVPIGGVVNINLNDTINLSDIINSSITPYTPISLNMYCYTADTFNFVSDNITNWTTPINLSDLLYALGVAYGNNMWIVVGASVSTGGGYIVTSYDNGKSWVGTDLSHLIAGGNCECVAYGNGIWVIGTDNGLIYSTDGTNFVLSSVQPFNAGVSGIAYGNGIFVAIGFGLYNIVYSTDGNNWVGTAASSPSIIADVAYGNGIFVVVGTDATYGLVTSQDGINWLPYTVSTSLLCVAYGAGRWCAIGGTNLYYSTDNWFSFTTITGVPYFTCITFGDTFVGGDDSGNIYYSTDFGNTWITSSPSFGLAARGIAYGNGVYVACGADTYTILIANATNLLTYTLEPVAIQPQTYVLPAPTIDWANTNYINDNLIITWFPVPGATHYKVFRTEDTYPARYINKETTKATTILNHSLNFSFFDYDSGPVYDTIFSHTQIPRSYRFNYFVFAYRHGVRSIFPPTQIFIKYSSSSYIIELWPVQQVEYIGGSNFDNFTTATARNLYTNQSFVMSSNDWANNWGSAFDGPTQIPYIGTNVPISNK